MQATKQYRQGLANELRVQDLLQRVLVLKLSVRVVHGMAVVLLSHLGILLLCGPIPSM